MSSAKRESVEERKLRERCGDEGWLCLKFAPPGQRGYPDRIVLVPARQNRRAFADPVDPVVVFVELKRIGGELSPLQRERIADLRKLGFLVLVSVEAETVVRKVRRYAAGV